MTSERQRDVKGIHGGGVGAAGAMKMRGTDEAVVRSCPADADEKKNCSEKSTTGSLGSSKLLPSVMINMLIGKVRCQ